ncbi:hypothetical protein BUALT_Bualt04G0175100 [Buddleja alternifolia]|uniref:WRKY domain-containing protein n=1 Tax=Buddleja alternifolia TaxID=168488 RepID=A0AAV6Y0I9_9LAMI|nr:hypothetical protein BUALT_Bualt04G0175100 [Buddleja alternifolia]
MEINNHPTLSLNSWIPASSNFAPNMVMNSLYDDTNSDRFVGFKREIGHFSTAELKDHALYNNAETELGLVAVNGETKASVGTGKKKAAEKKIRKPSRFAFQTRSIVDILDDGYRWRKYGQKSVKNKQFPRSYYRCTHHGCNVKKQVQRLCRDEGVVVTTYEGRHTHPVAKASDNFEQILNQMQIYPPL